ncbi:WhiB family transcriptional regulator [Streptomyces sp. NPDC054883]
MPPTSVRSAGSSAPLPCQRRPDIFSQPLLTNPPGGKAGPPLQTRRRQALTHAARQLCSSCPLWAECLRDAVVQSDPGGYAAGTTRQDRRWIRRRIALGDAQGRLALWPDREARHVDAEAVLAAFHALQEHWASRPALSSATGTPEGPVRQGYGRAHRVAASGEPHTGQQRVNTDEVSMAPPAGERITFSLDDPARAIQTAVLGPLVRSTLSTLEVTEQIAAMLVRMPTTGIRPELLGALGEVRRRLAAWCAASGDAGPYRPAGGGLTGSVSLELVTSDPLGALRQDIFEPLLNRLAESIRQIEVLTAVLSTAPDDGDGVAPGGSSQVGDSPDRAEPAALQTALGELGAHIAQYASEAPRPRVAAWPADGIRRDTPLRSVPDLASGDAPPIAPAAAPSLRRAVEQAVTSFPGPFTGRDVLLALPRGAYRQPAKSVSNALSAMSQAGRLLRVSRGRYALAAPSTGVSAASS